MLSLDGTIPVMYKGRNICILKLLYNKLQLTTLYIVIALALPGGTVSIVVTLANFKVCLPYIGTPMKRWSHISC